MGAKRHPPVAICGAGHEKIDACAGPTCTGGPHGLWETRPERATASAVCAATRWSPGEPAQPRAAARRAGDTRARASSVRQPTPALCSVSGVEPQWLFWVLWTLHFLAEPS